MPPGFLITLEGGDGSGKSTQARRLAGWLRRQGHRVLLTREPGGTPLGERLRDVLLTDDAVSPWTECLLFQALRAEHVAQVIRPALARGRIVLCDRYADSTMAYQGYGLGLDQALVACLTAAVTRGAAPDLTIILESPATAGLRRARRRHRMERRGLAFQRRVLAGFRAIARQDPRRCRLIRLHKDPTVTQQRIQQVVRDALARRRRS